MFGQKIIKRANDVKKEIKKMNALYIEEADLPSGCNMADMFLALRKDLWKKDKERREKGRRRTAKSRGGTDKSEEEEEHGTDEFDKIWWPSVWMAFILVGRPGKERWLEFLGRSIRKPSDRTDMQSDLTESRAFTSKLNRFSINNKAATIGSASANDSR